MPPSGAAIRVYTRDEADWSKLVANKSQCAVIVGTAGVWFLGLGFRCLCRSHADMAEAGGWVVEL